MPQSALGETTSLALKSASCSTVKRMSPSSSCGARNSSRTTDRAGNTGGRSAAAELTSATTAVRAECGPGDDGGCGSPGVRIGEPGGCGAVCGAFTCGPGPDGGCGSPGVRIRETARCGALCGAFTLGSGTGGGFGLSRA